MTLRFKAHFQDGVLVPDRKIELPSDITLDVVVNHDVPAPIEKPQAQYDDPNDPMPDGGVELVDWWSRHRIKLDPELVQYFAESDDFLDQDAADES